MKCYHEQHIRGASCTSRLESQWEAPKFDPLPVEPTLLRDQVENWQDLLSRASDDAGKVSNLQPFGGHLGDGVKYTLLAAFCESLGFRRFCLM